jgi:hypothetical protein
LSDKVEQKTIDQKLEERKKELELYRHELEILKTKIEIHKLEKQLATEEPVTK